MQNKMIANVNAFYHHLGEQGNFLTNESGYRFVQTPDGSWPCKVFEMNENQIDFKALAENITHGRIPNSLFFLENTALETQLHANGFKLTSVVTGMHLNLLSNTPEPNAFEHIEEVTSTEKFAVFANIASEAFSYAIQPETLFPLVKSNRIKTFIGKTANEYASCGMLMLDQNGVSGLHMIGTLKKHRGKGLGNQMTRKLLSEAVKNESHHAVLCASELGKAVYRKLGFIENGLVKGYALL
jgi:ribosomal protein S18 acetylase RimI-like enzyme